MDSEYTRDGLEESEASVLLPKLRGAREKTPLPVGQLSVLMLGQLAEPITATCILPFINQMIGEFDITHGDPSQVGYYVGLLVSLFFISEAVTVLWWSRLSDRIGRKPVLLIGLSALAISMVLMGLSTSFWPLVLSRMLCGAMNGNTGVAKSALGEITDSTNVAQAFALMPISWAVGVTIAPFMGGMLQRPAERFPLYFDTPFWRRYPYFLPCLFAGAFSFVCMIVTLLFFKETLHTEHEPRPTLNRADTSYTCPSSSIDPLDPANEPTANVILQNVIGGNPLGAASLLQGEPSLYPHHTLPNSSKSRGPMPLRELLQSPGVAISIANYGLLAILDIAYGALNPLVLASPVLLGGLGLDPPTIGIVMGAWGLLNGTFQATCFTRILERFGPRRTFVAGIVCFAPIFVCFGGANVAARLTHFGDEDQHRASLLVWAILALQALLVMIMDLSFGTIMMYIRASSPNKRSLGATNGMAQLLASTVRAIGPAASASMFAFSVSHNLLGGYAVYVVLVGATMVAIKFALKLPQDMEDDNNKRA